MLMAKTCGEGPATQGAKNVSYIYLHYVQGQQCFETSKLRNTITKPMHVLITNHVLLHTAVLSCIESHVIWTVLTLYIHLCV